MEKLSLILWRERELLEALEYRLEVEQLVMANGRTRWLARAARDVEHVLDQIRQVELLRSVAADEAAAALGLDPNPSLGGLIAAVDEPWSSILAVSTPVPRSFRKSKTPVGRTLTTRPSASSRRCSCSSDRRSRSIFARCSASCASRSVRLLRAAAITVALRPSRAAISIARLRPGEP